MTDVVEKLPIVEALPHGIEGSIQKRRGQHFAVFENPDTPGVALNQE